MASAPPWDYSGGPKGQPAPYVEGEFDGVAARAPLFGRQYREQAGRPVCILVPQPAAGAEWLYKHSGRSFLLVRSVFWQLVTSAVVATRASRLQVSFGPDVVARYPPSGTQAASLTDAYSATDCGLASGDTSTMTVAMNSQLILADNMSLGSNTLNRDVGDQYSLVAIYAEEFTDCGLNY
jgi:hypothetical protein